MSTEHWNGPATREWLLDMMPKHFKHQIIRFGKDHDMFMRIVRDWLNLNHYEPWNDDELLKVVKEILPPEPEKAAPAPRRAREAEPEAESVNDMPELLPFSKLPGYLLDPWGVPHRQGGQGRKPGKVPLENSLYHRRGRKDLTHCTRYSLTIGGERKRFYPRYLMRARIFAASEWRSKQREKLPLPESNPLEVAPALGRDNLEKLPV